MLMCGFFETHDNISTLLPLLRLVEKKKYRPKYRIRECLEANIAIFGLRRGGLSTGAVLSSGAQTRPWSWRVAIGLKAEHVGGLQKYMPSDNATQLCQILNSPAVGKYSMLLSMLA